MGKLIVFFIGLVVLALIIAAVVVYFRRKDGQEKAKEKGWAVKGDLNALQEKKILSENDGAEEIFLALLYPPKDLSFNEETTLLGSEHKAAIESWLRNKSRFTKSTRKV